MHIQESTVKLDMIRSLLILPLKLEELLLHTIIYFIYLLQSVLNKVLKAVMFQE